MINEVNKLQSKVKTKSVTVQLLLHSFWSRVGLLIHLLGKSVSFPWSPENRKTIETQLE